MGIISRDRVVDLRVRSYSNASLRILATGMACDIVKVRAGSNLSSARSNSRVSARARDKYFRSFITTKEGCTVYTIRGDRDYRLLGINNRVELASSYVSFIEEIKRVIMLCTVPLEISFTISFSLVLS